MWLVTRERHPGAVPPQMPLHGGVRPNGEVNAKSHCWFDSSRRHESKVHKMEAEKEISVIDQLRQMDVGEILEFPAGRSPYLRNLVSQRLIDERLEGQSWTVNLCMEKGVTTVTRTA